MFSKLGDIQYIRGCSVHGGDIMSTSGHVQYIREYHYECGGYHVYIGGCSVHRRNTISTLGGMFSTLEEIMMHVGDTMSTLRDVQHIRAIS